MKPHRELGTFSLLLLLAFGAAGAAVLRDRDSRFGDPLRRAVCDLGAALVVLTAGAGAAALCRPRARRRLATSPGLAAGLVGACFVAYCLTWMVVSWASGLDRWAPLPASRRIVVFFTASEKAVENAVLGTWVVQAVGTRRRSTARDWQERLSRLLGWVWLSLYGCEVLYPAIWSH